MRRRDRRFLLLGGLVTTFGSRTGVEVSTVTTSRTVTLKGYGTGVAVEITAGTGEWSKNGGAFAATAGTASDGDKIRVRLTSSASYETAVTMTLTVDTTELTFSATTRAADVVCTPFAFDPVTGAARSTVYESDPITVSGIEIAVAISITGGQYKINAGSYTGTAGTVEAADEVTVRATSSSSYETAVSAILSIGTVTGAFVIETGVEPPPSEGETEEDGTAWLQEDGTAVQQEA